MKRHRVRHSNNRDRVIVPETPALLRYVILEHTWKGRHYDLMLEWRNLNESFLKTWKLKEMLRPGNQEAEKLEDHRLKYLTYQGEISGNRGDVKRVAAGEYREIEIDEDLLHVELYGDVSGQLSFYRTNAVTWRLEWLPEDSQTKP